MMSTMQNCLLNNLNSNKKANFWGLDQLMKIMIWKSLLIIIALIVVSATPLMACPLADIDSAKQYLADGNYERSVAVLAACTQDNKSQAEAHFLLGAGRLHLAQIPEAEKHFDIAVQIDSAYRESVAMLYMQIGIGKLNQGKLKQADPLLERAAGFRADVKMEIAAASFQKGKQTLKKRYFDLAVHFAPHYRSTIFNFLMDKANNASDKRSAPLYELAIVYCGETCGLIKQAGRRLAVIVDRIEKSNPQDGRIVRYRTIASKIINLPLQTKIYTPGIYPFKLAKGEWTPWIRCNKPVEREYEFRSNNQKYEVLLRNGKKYRAWAGDRLPKIIDSDIRIKAAEDTVIFLTIH